MRIFLVLGLACAVRLFHLTAPIIGYHSWRQADTAAIARNFHENGYRFLYPQIDWGGQTTGFVESEFPLYCYVVALAYGAFGVSEALGRLLSLLCSLVAIYALYRLVRSTIDERTAFWSSVIYAFLPLNTYYSRAFMPESALLMSLILGMLFFRRWLGTGATSFFVLSAAFTSLAALLKLPSLYIGLPLLFLAWRRHGAALFRTASLWLYFVLVIAPVGIWYYHAHQLYTSGGVTFGIWEYGSDKWGNWELVISGKFWNRVVLQWLAERHMVYVGFLLFWIGLALPRRSPDERLFDAWLLALLAYVVIVAKGNYVHEYYLLPVMIPVSVFIGKIYARYFHPPRWDARSVALAIALGAMLILGGARYSTYMRAEIPSRSPLVALAQEVQRTTTFGERVVMVDYGDPTLMYLSHRRGWHAHPDQVTPEFVGEREPAGARYLVGRYRDFETETRRAALRQVMSLGELLTDKGADGFVLRLRD